VASKLTSRIVAGMTLLLSGGLIAFKVIERIRLGPGWDTYAFLANAADMAGKSIGYTELHRPPMLPMLTSLVFRIGIVDVRVIQVLDGVLTLVGIMVMYALLRRRFAPVPSGLGALALLSVPALWSQLGSGYTDFPSVALSGLSLLCFVKATEDDPRFYLAAFPALVAAVLMRFGSFVFLGPVALWLAFRWLPFRQGKRVLQGVLLGVAAYVPAAVYYVMHFNDVFYPLGVAGGVASGMDTGVVAAGKASGGVLAYAGGLVSTLTKTVRSLLAPVDIGWLAVAVTAVALIGLVLLIDEHLSASGVRRKRIVEAVLLILGALAMQRFGGLIARQLTIVLGAYGVWRLLAPRDGNEASNSGPRILAPNALDAVMLVWFLAFADAHGHMAVKVPRYFMTMAPGLIYLVILGWRGLADGVGERWRGVRRAARDAASPVGRKARALVWSLLAVALAVGFVGDIQWVLAGRPDKLLPAARASAEWLRSVEPYPERLLVYSDLWPLTSWYLGSAARPMPIFKDPAAYTHEMAKNHPDYFVTIRGGHYKGYVVAMTTGPVKVLKRQDRTDDGLPKICYLGKAWENYLEDLGDYRFDLVTDAGQYWREGTAFMDAYTPKQLAGYDAVAVYGVRWHDRGVAERTLDTYVRAGGVVFIDTSRNIGDLAYPLQDTILLGTIIGQKQLPREASLVVSADFASRHPGVLTSIPTSFLDESGGPWRGAVYAPLNPADKREVIASLNGQPVISIQRLGAGKIYWMADNLVWHAFYSKDPREARLIGAVIEDGLRKSLPYIVRQQALRVSRKPS
jgi:hypothetical protein